MLTAEELPYAARRWAGLITLPDRMQRVQARMARTVPLTLARTRCRFGRHVRLLRLFAWLTLLPTEGCLPQILHSLAMIHPHAGVASTRREALQRDG